MRVRRQLDALPALVVRVEGEAALVGALSSTIRADGRPSGVAVASAIASGTAVRSRAPPRTSARTGAAGRGRGRARPSHREYSPLSYAAPPMATTKTIDIRTAIPGPRSQAILERKQRVIANAKSIVLPIVAHEGRGATLTDVDGNTFIDFTGGVGCLNVGHSHPRVVEAAHRAARALRAHRLHDRPVRAVRRARRAPAREGAVPRPGEGGLLQRRHRGGRERGQVRAPLHRSAPP